MIGWLAIAGLFLTQPAQATTAAGAADEVVLADGTPLKGQVVGNEPRGKLTVVARRDWLARHLPSRLRAWEAVEAPRIERARRDRRARLDAWARERAPHVPPEDPLLAWIGQERARLDRPVEPGRFPLMRIEIETRQVRAIRRAGEDAARGLRQAWRAGFPEPEEMRLETLRQALEGRGFAQGPIDPASVEDLLPPPPESENRWLLRRAATELRHDAGLRFVRHGNLVLPEEQGGQAGDLAGAAASLLQGLLGQEPAEDPLEARLGAVEERGRVGVILTRLETAADFSAVTVESALLVRVGPRRWVPAILRPVTVRTDEVAADQVAPVAADPQVQAVFRVFEGFIGTDPGLQKRSLFVGAATQQALGRARAQLSQDLDGLALK